MSKGINCNMYTIMTSIRRFSLQCTCRAPKTGRTAQVCHIEIVRFVFLSWFWQVCRVTGWFMAMCVSNSRQCYSGIGSWSLYSFLSNRLHWSLTCLYFLILTFQLAQIFNLCIPSYFQDCIGLYPVYTFSSFSPSWHWFLTCVFLLIP